MAKIKTIDVIGKQWFDKYNGNSYYSARIIINYGMKTEKTILVPFTYGYGQSYVYDAMKHLRDAGVIRDAETYQNSSVEDIFRYCSRKGIILRHTLHENCKKAVVKDYGQK